MTWIIIAIDLASCMIILIAICIIPNSIVNRTNFYNQNNILISDFTIHLCALNLKGNKIYNELSQLIEHIKKVMAIEDKQYNDSNVLFYEINFPIMTSNQIDFLVTKNELEEDIYELTQNIERGTANGCGDPKQRLESLTKKLIDLKAELNVSFEVDLDDSDDVFLTFASRRQRKIFKDIYDVSKVKRCAYKCCGGNKYDHL